MKQKPIPAASRGRRASSRARSLSCAAALAGALGLASATRSLSVLETPAAGSGGQSGATSAQALEETRLSMNKWIETQQLIAKEEADWEQGREILAGRLDLLRKEVNTRRDEIKARQEAVAAAAKKLEDARADEQRVQALVDELTRRVAAMEARVQALVPSLPEPVRERIDPLLRRMPEDPANARVRAAERFQNVVGILNEINKANGELMQQHEVHTLADGRRAEVQAIYLGLAQAYYVSAGGEAGIGRPTPDGWTWETSKTVASDVHTAFEILEGKHTPAFVPLPVRLQ